MIDRSHAKKRPATNLVYLGCHSEQLCPDFSFLRIVHFGFDQEIATRILGSMKHTVYAMGVCVCVPKAALRIGEGADLPSYKRNVPAKAKALS